MDRNTVIATVLITLILFGWLYFFNPPAPPPTSEQALEDSLFVEQPEEPAEPEEAALAVDTTLGATTGEERLVTVVSDLYTATFSSKGGTLVSFRLNEYDKADRESAVQIVDTAAAGALALEFTTPRSRNVDSRALYFSPSFAGDTLRVTGDSTTLAFEAALGDGTLRQTYVFKPETYEVGWLVGGENAGAYMTSDGYDVLWDGAIPYAEESKEEEVRRSGAYARSGGSVEYVTLQGDPVVDQTLTGIVDWVAIKSKYFVAILIPSQQTDAALLEGERVGDIDDPEVEERYQARLEMAPLRGTDAYRLYLGPMEYSRLAAYDLDLYDMVDYGYDFLEFLTRPIARFIFIPFFTLLGTFISNYGVIIILLALLVKIVTHPLQRSAYRSMGKMRKLQPQMQAIKEKYADDPQKQQQAVMSLYRDAGANPLGGCLPMLLQYPILIALWMFLPQAMAIRQQPFLWASDLSAPDAILSLPFTIPLYGNFVAGFTLLMGLSLLVQMRIQMRSQPTNPQMQGMMYIMPIVLFLFFNKQAAGLSLYYLCYNVLSALQQWWINKQMDNEPEPAVKPAASKSPVAPRSPRKKKPALAAGNGRARRR